MLQVAALTDKDFLSIFDIILTHCKTIVVLHYVRGTRCSFPL